MMAEGIVEDVVGDHHSVRDNCSNRDEKEDGDFEDSSSFCPSYQGIAESSVAIGDGTSRPFILYSFSNFIYDFQRLH